MRQSVFCHVTRVNKAVSNCITPIFSGGLYVAKRRKGRPVEALQGRNELQCLVRQLLIPLVDLIAFFCWQLVIKRFDHFWLGDHRLSDDVH